MYCIRTVPLLCRTRTEPELYSFSHVRTSPPRTHTCLLSLRLAAPCIRTQMVTRRPSARTGCTRSRTCLHEYSSSHARVKRLQKSARGKSTGTRRRHPRWKLRSQAIPLSRLQPSARVCQRPCQALAFALALGTPTRPLAAGSWADESPWYLLAVRSGRLMLP